MSPQLPFIRPGASGPQPVPTPEAAPDPHTPAGPDQPLSLIYEPYYGLKEKPFSLSSDPRFLYKSRSHALAFDELLAGIRRREGLVVLTGDIGTGKTTLCRAVLQQLDRKTFTTFVPDPFLTREDLLKMLLVEFGVMSTDDLKSGRLKGASRPELTYPLYEFLNALVPLQAFAVLVIDEAQHLPLQLLEEIRILSDLEGREKLLQVVLVGQLELRTHLKLPEMRQIDQRVSVRCSLEPLGLEGVVGYVLHRLAVAGGGNERVGFSTDALAVVHRASGGVPRLINVICDRALQRAFVERLDRIGPDLVHSAVVDLGLASESLSSTAYFDSAELHEPHRPVMKTAEMPPGMPLDADLKALLDVHPPSSLTAAAPPDQGGALEGLELNSGDETEAAVPWNAFGSKRIERRKSPWRNSPFAIALVVASVAGLALASVGYVQVISQAFAASEMVYVPSPPVLRRMEAINPVVAPPAEPAAAVPRALAPAGILVPAAVPSTGAFVIQVASFESAAPAALVMKELVDSGYRSYQVDLDLGERGHLHQVLVGRYDTRAAAETDLVLIRERRGYADARVVGTSRRVSP